MIGVWRSLARATAICLTVGIAAADAQTVIVISAPPGSNVEFVLEGTVAASATVDQQGRATLAADRSKLGTRTFDASVWVDNCGDVRRVLIVDRAIQPPAPGTCSRVQVEGIFFIQRISSLVVDIGGTVPIVRLRQGEPPAEWLLTGAAARTRPRSTAPSGLVLFGGFGLGTFTGFGDSACGDVTGCSAETSPRVLAAGASYWFSQFAAAEVSFLRPSELTATGTGDAFEFDSTFDGGLITVAGLGGGAVGPVRIYGKGGLNYHEATLTTNQTVEERTITVGDVTQTIPGGTTRVANRTRGWGWLFGGGVEVWVSRRVGIYGEFTLMRLQGSDVDDGDAEIDETARAIIGGVRVHIPGLR